MLGEVLGIEHKACVCQASAQILLYPGSILFVKQGLMKVPGLT